VVVIKDDYRGFIEGQEYAFLQGEAANYMGLMQVIGVIESGRDI
jgi:hypothetical protein